MGGPEERSFPQSRSGVPAPLSIGEVASSSRFLSALNWLLSDLPGRERLLQKFRDQGGLLVFEISEEGLGHPLPKPCDFDDGLAAFRCDLDEVRPFVGAILAPENVAILFQALQSPPGVGSVDEKSVRERVLSDCTFLLAKQCQQPGFGVIQAETGEVSLSGLVAATGEFADQIEEGEKAVHGRT